MTLYEATHLTDPTSSWDLPEDDNQPDDLYLLSASLPEEDDDDFDEEEN